MIKAEDLKKYLGTDENSLTLARKAVEVIAKNANPRCVEATALLDRTDGEIKVCNMMLSFKGKDIADLLDGCDNVYFFCATLGGEVDNAIENLKHTDLTLAYAADLCAGLWIDAYCDELEQKTRRKLREKGLYLTQRFSCGYGDFPLETQSQLVSSLLADKFLGIRLTTGGMMMPSKSVTAVAGICDSMPKSVKRCAVCPKKDVCDGGLCSD